MASVITSIRGLQNLTGLKRFNADYNGLESVNLSNLPNLENVDISDCDIPGTNTSSLKSVNVSNSTSIKFLRLDDSNFSTGIPNLSGLSDLIVLDFDQCNISGALNFSEFPVITDIDVFGNAGITSVTISDTQPITFFNAANCGLTEAAIDNILIALDNNGLTSGIAYLDGGTNAIPSATGLAAASNLQAKSWTVQVNS